MKVGNLSIVLMFDDFVGIDTSIYLNSVGIAPVSTTT